MTTKSLTAILYTLITPHIPRCERMFSTKFLLLFTTTFMLHLFPFLRCYRKTALIKGATKLYFTHYSYVTIALFKQVYSGLHFLPILLKNQFFVFQCFLCFLFRIECFETKFQHALSLFKKVVCNFIKILFIKILFMKTCFHRGVELFKRNQLYKVKC